MSGGLEDIEQQNQLGSPLLAEQASSFDRYDVAQTTESHHAAKTTDSILNSLVDSATVTSTIVTEDCDHPSSNQGDHDNKKISWVLLSVILFFNASGGPFGVEPSVKAAGNLFTIIGFAVMPILWALPEAYMTYELSSIYPDNSGGMRWVQEAFGEKAGLITGYLGYVAGVTTSASFPVLFVTYVHEQYFSHLSELNWLYRYLSLASLAIALMLVSFRGLQVVGRVSVAIFLITVTPFLLMLIFAIPKIDPSKWLETPSPGQIEHFDDDALEQTGWWPFAYISGISLRPFINNLYWNFNGFDQGGHLSSKDTTTPDILKKGIMGSFFLVSSAYLVPILVATGATDFEQENWNAGAFATAGNEIAGRWLGNWIVVAAGCTLLAQFFTECSLDSLQVLAMADKGFLPSIFRTRSKYDTPTFGLLLALIIILLLLPLKFSIIVELSNFSFVFAVSAEFVAFAELRIRKGDGSMLRRILYTIMIIPPLLLNVAVLLLASYATYIYGAIVTTLGIVLVYSMQNDVVK